MDEEIQAAPLLLQARENGVDRRNVLDVAGKHKVGAELLGDRPDPLRQHLALIGEGELGPVPGEHARDPIGDRVIVGDAHDQASLALHQSVSTRHSVSSSNFFQTIASLEARGPGRLDREPPGSRMILLSHASGCLNTKVALVPPKPKELDSTARRFTLSRR